MRLCNLLVGVGISEHLTTGYYNWLLNVIAIPAIPVNIPCTYSNNNINFLLMGYCSVMPCHTPLSKHQSYPLVMKYGSLNTRTHTHTIYIYIRYHIFMFFPAIRASISHRMLLVINSQNLTSQSSHIPLNHFLKEYPIQSLWQNNALWHHHQGAGTPGLPTGGSGKGG